MRHCNCSYIVRVNVSDCGTLADERIQPVPGYHGRIFSAFLLGYALFQVPAGAMADRWGARRVLTLAAWIWVGITVLFVPGRVGPFQTTAYISLIAFMVIRFFLGVAESPTYPDRHRSLKMDTTTIPGDGLTE